MSKNFLYRKGLQEIGGGAYAFLSGSEGFGLSNSGLVTSKNESLVIDTLYDIHHAQEMIDAIAEVTSDALVRYVFNTHTDGDHFFGNQLFSHDTEIITTKAASALMTQEHVNLTASFFAQSQDATSHLHVLGGMTKSFNLDHVRARAADTTFSHQKALKVGDLTVELHEFGPAHTVSDAIAYVPEHNILFSGDLLTRDPVPVVWSGSVPNWLAALEHIRSFHAEIIIPGHGPILVDKQINTAIDSTIEFWSYMYEQGSQLYQQGIPVEESIKKIPMDKYPHAIIMVPIIISAVYHEYDPNIPYRSLTEAFDCMASQLAHINAYAE